jgi:hypothetical protein
MGNDQKLGGSPEPQAPNWHLAPCAAQANEFTFVPRFQGKGRWRHFSINERNEI